MVAFSAQSVGIIGSFITTAALGVAALLRAGRGDKALTVANNATSLWEQMQHLVDQLQEENRIQREVVRGCELKCVEVKVAADLVMAELGALKLDHAKVSMELRETRSELKLSKEDRARLTSEVESLKARL